ncbi:MAG: nuclease ue [Abditibacteriota bacterium]|nr:nuclease ue [Abditibacteriota bacterium]
MLPWRIPAIMQCDFTIEGADKGANDGAEKYFGGWKISSHDHVKSAMKRFLSRQTLWMALGVSSLSLAGCDSALQTVLPAPTPVPTPTPVATPRPDVFDPADGITPLQKLNDSDPASPALPDKFRVARVDTGDLVWIQSVSTVTRAGKATKSYGKPDIARLAGIFVPAAGQPGWAETVKTVQNWTLGQEVDVEQDGKYPVDLNSRRLIQIFFNGRTPKTAATRFNLNRMLVRSGYAVVDLHAPTSIDVKPWLNDEEYARNHRLGLWGKGIVLYQRIPIPAPKGSKLQVQRVGAQNKTTQTTRRLRQNVTTSTNNAAGAPPGAMGGSAPPPGTAPGGPPPGAPGSAPSVGGPPPENVPPPGPPPGAVPPGGAPPAGGPPPP